ncbi:MAG TPA: hypothetical protein VMT20_13840 [Terriglobia bacterium]|nr:hypothetical protein [Terriglobia bacterium]
MADQQRNAANAVFGLNDPPAGPRAPEAAPGYVPAPPQPAPPGYAPAPPTGGYAPAPPASYPPAQPAAQPAGGYAPPAPASYAPAQPSYAAAPPASYTQTPPSQPTGYSPAPPSAYAPAPVLTPPPARNTALIVLVAVLVVLAGVNLYLVLSLKQTFQQASTQQGEQLTSLTRRMDLGDDRYAQLKAQFQVTSEKLGMTEQELGRARTLAANIQQQQKAAVDQLNQAIAQKAGTEQLNQVQADANAKINGVSSDLSKNVNDLNKRIGDTNDALTGTKGELSGAIARTHDELVALAHKTDRDYFEFSLTRGKQQKVGSVQARLEKINTKKNLYTVDLFFDDKRIVRKDQALDSPVFFYMQGAPSTLELVVNKLAKDTAAGYISAPKGFFPNATNVLQQRPGGSAS